MDNYVKPSLNELAHYGVKGMKWGVRKSEETGAYRLQIPEPKIDSSLPQSTKIASKEIAMMIGERYNFPISEIKAISPNHPAYGEPGLMGFVEYTPGKSNGVIHVVKEDPSKKLKDAEDIGWFGKDAGNTRAFLTHESAHALFHSDEDLKAGFFGPKTVGKTVKARDVALKAAIKEARKSGIPIRMFMNSISGYAAASGLKQEAEAEMFAQYHWTPNPPSFIKTWGETLHRELGLDATPFRERR